MSESIVNEDDVVFKATFETKIYPNAGGEITIEQICWPDENVIITIPPYHVERVVKALRRAKKDLSE